MKLQDRWVKKSKNRLDENRICEDQVFNDFFKIYKKNERRREKDRNQRGCLRGDWEPADLAGKRIHIFGENGIGDEILTASCLSELVTQSKCNNVTWCCNPKLEPLFTRSFRDVEFICETDPQLNAECTIYSWELIGRFRNNLDDFNWITIGHFKPYIKHSRPLEEELRAQYSTDSRPVVGLAWRSERKGELLSDKTCGLRDVPQWAKFFDELRDKVRFISLQYGDTRDEISFARWKYGIEIYQDDSIDTFNNVDSAVAQIAAVDYVVSISSTPAHFAGALGTPGWVMLQKKPFAHWRAGKYLCPWYPTLRTIRQKNSGDWQYVLDTITEELVEEIKCNN